MVTLFKDVYRDCEDFYPDLLKHAERASGKISSYRVFKYPAQIVLSSVYAVTFPFFALLVHIYIRVEERREAERTRTNPPEINPIRHYVINGRILSLFEGTRFNLGS